MRNVVRVINKKDEFMIKILMATYNGEKYISQQIDSILNQTVCDWKLFVQDDCSTDNTVSIIEDYMKQFPNKIFLHINDKPSGSSSNNFFSLIKKQVDGDENDEYLMLCDQDDVWEKDKIECLIALIKKEENIAGKNFPLLAHSNVCVVDRNLSKLPIEMPNKAPSECGIYSKKQILLDNVVTGCTALFNKALLKKITQIPDKCVMHDYWLAFVAIFFGKILFCEKPTVLYRQHSNNVMGTKKETFLDKLSFKRLRQSKALRVSTCDQAKSFLDIYLCDLSNNDIKLLEEYSSMYRSTYLHRLHILIVLKMWRNTLGRKLVQLL